MTVLEKAELNILRMHGKATESLVLMMGVEMQRLKERIKALELDSHPPINLTPAVEQIVMAMKLRRQL